MNINTQLEVVVADKNPKLHEHYRQYMQTMGIEHITLAINEKELTKVLSQSPDVIFLNNNMIFCAGIDKLISVKAASPFTYLVFISEQHNMHLAFRAMQCGAIDHIIIIKGDKERTMSVAVTHIMELVSKQLFETVAA